MHIRSESITAGVAERGFDLEVGKERVPGIVWAPQGARGARPVVLLGHGGTLHKRFEGIVRMAHGLVRNHGYAAVAIDAPGHGERSNEAEQMKVRERFRVSPPSIEELRDWHAKTIPIAVAEWKATLDAVQTLDYIADGPVGYCGFSMGGALGIPLAAAEPRVRAAVFGLVGLSIGTTAFEAAARSLTIPILFVIQQHDEVVPLETGLALFQAFASPIKTMHLNPGGHLGIPAFERDEYELFFRRNLGEVAPSAQ
jgi:pimeloyl-ACP methyl ester carboxylesterase